VIADVGLPLGKSDRSCAHLGLELGLEGVFGMGPGWPSVREGGGVRLGPKVARIGRSPAELQGDEMVFLIVRGLGVGVPILADLLDLQSVGE